jgi:single-strand DNA-binding protein
MNIVVLRGSLSRPAERRELQSGSVLVSYEVTVRRTDDERADTVPVVWFDPPASAGDLDIGEEVVVTGRVRRRFFRAGGYTQSRTEVVADVVVPARRRKRAADAIDAALAQAIGDGGIPTGGAAQPLDACA